MKEPRGFVTIDKQKPLLAGEVYGTKWRGTCLHCKETAIFKRGYGALPDRGSTAKNDAEAAADYVAGFFTESFKLAKQVAGKAAPGATQMVCEECAGVLIWCPHCDHVRGAAKTWCNGDVKTCTQCSKEYEL